MKKKLLVLALIVLATLFTSCEKNYYVGSGYPTTTPEVSTLPVTNITSSTALSGGNTINNNNVELGILLKGVCWSNNLLEPIPIIYVKNGTFADGIYAPQNVTIRTLNGSGTNNYISTVTGLKPNTTYYPRAYVTYFDKRFVNSTGIAYGNTIIFTTP